MEGPDGRPVWLLVLKLFFLCVFQLAVLLTLWLVLDPDQPPTSAILFFMLFPYVAYPLIFSAGRIGDLYDVETAFSLVEVYCVGAFATVLLPLLILLPIYFEVPMDEQVRDMLLGFTIALPSIWVPVLVGSAWGPASARHKHEAVMAADESATFTRNEIREMRVVTAGVFCFLSVPLGFFVPMYLGVEHEEAGEAVMVLVMLVAHIGAYEIVLAPRIGLFLHVDKSVGITASIPEAIVKLVYGSSILPMVILLPIYLHGVLRIHAQRTLAAFMLGLPSAALLEACRVSHREALAKLPVLLALVYFGLVMPIGVLLPAWLSGEPDGTGKSLFLAFMMSPLVLCLIGCTIFTAVYEPRLPFQPIDYYLEGDHRSFDMLYAGTGVVLPVVLLLPVYFEGGLEDTPALITLCYMCMISGLLVIMFAISFRSASAPEVQDADVQNLPYASAQETLRTNRLDTDPFTPGRKTANSSRAALTLATLSSDQGDDADGAGNNDELRQRRDTAMSGLSGFDVDDERPTDAAANDSRAKGGISTARQASTGSRQSSVWNGWETGMACKAEFPSDGGVYDAKIVSLDWGTRRATVEFKDYDGDHEDVPMSRLYSADDPVDVSGTSPPVGSSVVAC
eukprot:m.181682 g.181682  ORF g.181682 m.181682 type:complete len:623 (+) comp15333_c0_seq1:270-2138(+)